MKIRLLPDKKRDIFLYKTRIENLFISEYLPDAPGDYVKVFLFGLMYAQFEQAPNRRELSKILGLSEDEIEEAWIYWESRGLVKVVRERDENNEEVRSIVFVSKIDELYGKMNEALTEAVLGEDAEEETGDEEEDIDVPLYVSIDDMEFDDILSSKLVDKRLRALYQKYAATCGRTISRQDTSKIEEAVKVYGIEPEIFDFAIDYCADLGKFNIDYIFKVALRWTEAGCSTVEEARRLLERDSLRNSWYRQVFKALGFNRLPAPADREIMDRWFDGMKCSIDEVLDACAASAGIRDPNLRYVNKVLENRKLEKGGINTRAPQAAAERPAGEDGSPVSRKVLSDYFEFIRAEEEKARKERTAEVLAKLPEMKSILEAENSVNARLLSLKPGAASMEARQKLRAERIGIEENKKVLLTENGFPADHLNLKYRCSKCRDTGYTDEGMVCSCCRQRAEEAYTWHTNKEKA